MDKRAILAVAGAGKTYTICNSLDASKSNLIIAFTHRNVRNIMNELTKKYKDIPKLTYVKTFDSFLLSHFIKPHFSFIKQHFKLSENIMKGVTFKAPPSLRIKGGLNPYYKKDNLIEHYIENNLLFCERFSKLIIKTKNEKINLVDTALEGILKFYDYIYIDEFQDFRNYDYELIEKLIKKCNNIVLVGDYYQHSVSGKNNSGKPFDNTTYESYVNFLKGKKLLVDQMELQYSRRCSKDICDFVKKKLKINIESANLSIGTVCFVNNENEAKRIIENDKITKLVHKDSKSFLFSAINWGYSKGDTLNSVCIILTGELEELDKDDFDIKKIKQITINSLYVAITRTKSDLYVIKKTLFDTIKNVYKLQNNNNNGDVKTSNNNWINKKSKNGNPFLEKKYKSNIIRIFEDKYGKFSLAKYKEQGFYSQKFSSKESAEIYFIEMVKQGKNKCV